MSLILSWSRTLKIKKQLIASKNFSSPAKKILLPPLSTHVHTSFLCNEKEFKLCNEKE